VNTLDLRICAIEGEDLESYVVPARYLTLRDLSHARHGEAEAVDENAAKLVVIRVEFCNKSGGPIQFKFENLACKAELLNLEVRAESGELIPPVGRIHIRLKNDTAVPPTVEVNGRVCYDLIGEVAREWLVFPGAKYRIPDNGLLDTQFKFNGSISNTLRLKLKLLPVGGRGN
jgi:hypothetical protein